VTGRHVGARGRIGEGSDEDGEKGSPEQHGELGVRTSSFLWTTTIYAKAVISVSTRQRRPLQSFTPSYKSSYLISSFLYMFIQLYTTFHPSSVQSATTDPHQYRWRHSLRVCLVASPLSISGRISLCAGKDGQGAVLGTMLVQLTERQEGGPNV
jgi:hypothetical protein